MRISLLHPSRGRPVMASQAHDIWINHASGRHSVEYILSLDTDDGRNHGYKSQFTGRAQILVNDNRSIVDAVNRAAEICTGEILIVVSDDFDCPMNWDELIVAALAGNDDTVLHVHDGLFGELVTLPILTRKYYERLGYIYYPDYFSMFCDTELTYHARQEGKLMDARHLVFQHKHYMAGLSPEDETYLRENSTEAWAIGEKIFSERRKKGFPCYSPS